MNQQTSDRKPVAVITGGGSGIGLALAESWASSGWQIVIMDANQTNLDEAIDTIGGDHLRTVLVDVTDSEQVSLAFNSIRHTEGALDVLVNSAGIAIPAASSTVAVEDFSKVIDINLIGTMRCSQAAFELLRESNRAAIVNIGSVASHAGMPGRASYTASKAGVAGLTRTLATEWAEHGIRVNAVGPGYVRTALTDRQIQAGTLNVEPLEKRTPMGRLAEPGEIASVIDFLASPAASYVTGHLLMADGGMTIAGNWYS